MIPSGFSVEIANYALDLPALRAVRDVVFVQEQNVPLSVELDGIDPQCRHVLARDANGHPIGTGRLTPSQGIGRLAVLRDWRGRGVGAAMLQALLDLARSLGHERVELHAQVDAIGFYERFGFEAVGDEYLEAGIRHRTMQRTLDALPGPARLAPESSDVAVDSLAQAHELGLQIIKDSRRNLWLYSRDLDQKLYGTPEMVEAFKRFAIDSRGGELRILVHDATTPLRDGHPLVALLQRLSSSIRVRVPEVEQDLQYPGAFLLGDRGGYLYRPLGSRYEGTANLRAPARQRQLRDYFDQVWERSLPAVELRQIHL